MARCTSFIYCTAICCCIILVLMGLVGVGGTAAAYVLLLGSAKVTHGLAIMELSPVTIMAPMGVFFGISLALLIIGAVGLWKARKMEQKPKIMVILALVLLFLAIILGVLILIIMLYISTVMEELDTTMATTLEIAANDTSAPEREDWNNVHDAFSCCGVTDGWDWLEGNNSIDWANTVPVSCGDTVAQKQARPGCKGEVQSGVVSVTVMTNGILAFIGGVMLINIIIMLAVGIQSWRDPTWMRLRNEIDEGSDEGGSEKLGREDTLEDMEEEEPEKVTSRGGGGVTSPQDVRLQRNRGGARGTAVSPTPRPGPPEKKANPVLVR